MLHVIGIIISLFLSTLLFTKKGKSKADQILAIWLSLISLHLLLYYLQISGKFVEFPYLLGLEIPMPLIHGPFLYLYTASLTNTVIRRSHWFLHFVPVLLSYLILSHFFLLSSNEKTLVYQNQGIGYKGITSVIRIAVLLSGLSYVTMCLFRLRRHHENITNQFSSLEKINLNWLMYLMIGIGIIWFSVFFGDDMSTFTLADLFILFIGYFGVKQVGIFTNKVALMEELTESRDASESYMMHQNLNLAASGEKIKYQKSILRETSLSDIHSRLTSLMQKEKLFKDPDLSLTELAQHLKVHANALSQVINIKENKPFYDYINEQRIAEFKTIVVLPGNQRFTLLSLAYEVGFNSKTSFNRNFKKVTGLAPTAYLKEQKIELQNPT